MLPYTLRRLSLIPITILGIIAINFFIVQIAPGGPVEQLLSQINNSAVVSATIRVGGGESFEAGRSKVWQRNASFQSLYRGAQGLDPNFIDKINQQFGFDQPAYIRFWRMVCEYLTFDFGKSYFLDRAVLDLVLEKLPVSVSLGVWSTILIYATSIPLGIAKAVRHGSSFDVLSSAVVIVCYAIPSFLVAILLINLFAGGEHLDWFPLRGLVSDNWGNLSWHERVIDYFWHLTLPIVSVVVGNFASLTMFTKNSFLDEINKQYVMTARAKGLNEIRILYRHVFRNAMLLVIAGFPEALLGMFFTGSLLIEVIFSLDGIGLLSFEAVIKRDYPVMFGTLYIFSLIGLLMNVIKDLIYHWADPRICFLTLE